MTLRCGILTLKTSDSFFRSFRFLRQNEAFSATEQNQTYKNSLSFRNLNAIQLRTTFFSGVCRIPPLSHRLNNWFHLESTNRRTKILYELECDVGANKNHSLLGNPLILPQIQILISFWSQKAETLYRIKMWCRSK